MLKDDEVEQIPFADRGPVGQRERLAFFRNIATSIECQGLRATRSEALELLRNEAKAIQVRGFPEPGNLMWREWGRLFGKYLVFCTYWEGKFVVNMLHTLANEAIYWERYKAQGQNWFAQHNGVARLPGSRLNREDFLKKMIKMGGQDIEEFLLIEIYGYVSKNLENLE